MKKSEHDEKSDKGGNRGSNYGMGKETHSRGDLSEGDLKKGCKVMGKPSLKEEVRIRK